MKNEPLYPCYWERPENYSGPDYYDWCISGFARSRDSDAEEESNFLVAKKALATYDIKIVRDSHWACGWIEYILIHKKAVKALTIAKELNEKRQEYPILDETIYNAVAEAFGENEEL